MSDGEGSTKASVFHNGTAAGRVTNLARVSQADGIARRARLMVPVRLATQVPSGQQYGDIVVLWMGVAFGVVLVLPFTKFAQCVLCGVAKH